MATSYRVLRELAELAAYEPLVTIEAASGEAAIRRAVEKLDPEKASGTYVAVPARSWTEQQVVVEQTPRVTLSDPPRRPRLLAEDTGSSPARADVKSGTTS